jgi:dTDP-4-amino-4,6-dideoxygalactose transaminase
MSEKTLENHKVASEEEITHLLSGGGTAIPLFKVHMPETVFARVIETLASGYIGQGPRVAEFEKALAPWFGNPNVLTVNSGTSALHLALRLAGVGYGDEVISTAMTCTATNEPILERGARIVWADIDPMTANIDPQDVERKISPRTKAIMVVHWGGYPCDLDELNAIAQKHNIKLIEDAAHAFGAAYQGHPVGSYSDFVCFSFQAIKHLTTVDGGALVCKSEEDYRRGKLLRWYGIDRETPRADFRCEEDVAEYGYKFHMNDVCATIGLQQLAHVGSVLDRHRANAAYYNEQLKGLSGVTVLAYQPDRVSSYWLYTLLVQDRLDFMRRMQEAKITVSQVHARNDKHTMMRDFVTDLPGVDTFVEKQVSIPVGWWLTDAERAYIAATIKSIRS